MDRIQIPKDWRRLGDPPESVAALTVCPSADEWEEYTLRRLPEDEEARLEEHLLTCGTCQDTAGEVEEYVNAARSAARELLAEEEERRIRRSDVLRRWFGFRLSRVAVTCAAAAVMIAALMPLMRTSPARSVDVDLEAWRGEVGAEAPAGRPLRLRVAGEGLPQQASFALEVVSESGGVTRRVEGVLDAATIHGELREGLAAGRYWVRVVDARGNQVLRESMLTVR